ncbi:MAG: hypothetical protein IJP82_09350 [Bacteroidaceae bacterium]|nr:hypothetical protein [Bacteroidaceae bacterium]
MKKILLVLAATSMTMAAQAKILRVSNVAGSSAPYTTFEAAHDAASSGDTIMLDASAKAYGDEFGRATITKSLVILGPGYWLVENGIVEEGAGAAQFSGLTIKADGTVVKGMWLSQCNIEASKVVINRCRLSNSTSGIIFKSGFSNCIISQNIISGGIGTSGGTGSFSTNHQITNNIFTVSMMGNGFSQMKDCYIAYNTFRTNEFHLNNVLNSTVEYNLWKEYKESAIASSEGCSVANNYETAVVNTQATNAFIDKDYYDAIEYPADVRATYGAFAGDSPYILSGIPSGPIIQDLIVPTTVEKGSTMSVTVKVGVVK